MHTRARGPTRAGCIAKRVAARGTVPGGQRALAADGRSRVGCKPSHVERGRPRTRTRTYIHTVHTRDPASLARPPRNARTPECIDASIGAWPSSPHDVPRKEDVTSIDTRTVGSR